MEDKMVVNVRCSENGQLVMLTQKNNQILIEKHETYENDIKKFEFRLLRMNKKYPLDYIIGLPKLVRNKENLG